MKINLNDKIKIVKLINEACISGARKFIACQLLKISLRTIERWGSGEIIDKRRGAAKKNIRKLTKAEESDIISIACSDKYKDLTPHEIVPLLAENRKYIASVSSFYRILKKYELMKYRSNKKPAKNRKKPDELVASGPDQVWCWDITYLKSNVSGLYFYCYMIMDIWTKEIVGWTIHDTESAELAKELFLSLKEKYNLTNVRLHSDNGSPMKAAVLLLTLYKLGVMPSFSRPRVSNDNAYIESLFSTMKYVPNYPKAFNNISDSREWMSKFVNWYNNTHRHSSIGYVTPVQRRKGQDKILFEKRNETIKKAREKHPERWGKKIKIWEAKEKIYLNKYIDEKDKHRKFV